MMMRGEERERARRTFFFPRRPNADERRSKREESAHTKRTTPQRAHTHAKRPPPRTESRRTHTHTIDRKSAYTQTNV
jgi:hypothetical protein